MTQPLPGIFKFNKGKWRSSSVFQIYVCYFAEFVKQIFDVFGANVRRQIADIDTSFIITRI